MGGIFDSTLAQLKAAMDYRVARQGVISSNIANMDTPGYRAKELSFDEQLESSLRLATTHPEHRGGRQAKRAYRMEVDAYARIGNDANTVDIDREMMKLSQNQLLYDATAQTVERKLAGIKDTIKRIK